MANAVTHAARRRDDVELLLGSLTTGEPHCPSPGAQGRQGSSARCGRHKMAGDDDSENELDPRGSQWDNPLSKVYIT